MYRFVHCMCMFIWFKTRINMFVHVHTRLNNVHTCLYLYCTYHVRTVYRRVYTFSELYKHVHTCLYISQHVHTCLNRVRTIALSKGVTYMVQTCLYTFMPGGQDSRWTVGVWTNNYNPSENDSGVWRTVGNSIVSFSNFTTRTTWSRFTASGWCSSDS